MTDLFEGREGESGGDESGETVDAREGARGVASGFTRPGKTVSLLCNGSWVDEISDAPSTA